ncbi:mechanosensitive ion channel family protein [Methanospirillum sp.]
MASTIHDFMDPANVHALIIFISGMTCVLLITLIGKYLKKIGKKTETAIDDIIVSSIGKPLIFSLCIATGYYSLFISTIIPTEYKWILDSKYLMVIFTIIGTWIVWSFIRSVGKEYEERIIHSTSNTAALKLYHFFRATYTYIICILSFLIILEILDIDITPLLATGGIIAVAASFAGKEILGNFFSGAVLAADQPFKAGDRIEVQDYLGDVIAIGPRSTRIKTLDSQLVTVPNSILTNDIVVNYAEPDIQMKVRVNIGVSYGSDIDRVRAILLEIASEAIDIGICIKEPAPSVYFLEFGASSLNFQLIVWTQFYSMAWDVQDFVNVRIFKKFKEEGIEIPFPQMDVHMKPL